MTPAGHPARRVLIPPALPSTALRGRGSGLSISRLAGTTMGTFWSVSCLLPNEITGALATAALEASFAEIISQMSHWDPTSDLCRFNRAPAGTWQVLPAEFYFVLTQALEIAAASDGFCDPTLGEIVDFYGFGPNFSSSGSNRHHHNSGQSPSLPPDSTPFQQAIQRCGWQKLQLAPARQAALQPGALRLDLSAIAKGYAVDHAAEALETLGISSYLIEIGGEVRGAGCKPDGDPWWCLLESPDNPAGGSPAFPETIAALCGLSLATSGDTYRQKSNLDGQLISHLIDPRTFRPTDRTLATVSVFAPTCLQADAWSTALFTAGPIHGPTLAQTHHLPALFTWRTPKGYQQCWSPALALMFD